MAYNKIRKPLFIITALLISYCSHASDWSGNYINEHDITMANADKQYRVEDASDTLVIEQHNANTWHFELFVIARSANMCDVSGEAKQISHNLLEYKDSDFDCTLHLERKGNNIHIKDIEQQCQSYCGLGAYLDGLFFSPKPETPKLKTNQAIPLKKISNDALTDLKSGDWEERIKQAYMYRSKLFHGIEFNKLDWYQSKIKNNKYYLFSKHEPFFIILNHDMKKEWQLINLWKIEYPKNTKEEQEWSIYPAIYPISDYQEAIAITHSLHENYSGGGTGLTLASIIPLEISESTLDLSQAIISSMPFSCYSSIRACFSEEEYTEFGDINGESRCHDDASGYLTLKTQRSKTSSDGFYNWRLTWNERFLKGLTTSPEEKIKERLIIDLNQKERASCDTFSKFNFCGGGQDDHCGILEQQLDGQ